MQKAGFLITRLILHHRHVNVMVGICLKFLIIWPGSVMFWGKLGWILLAHLSQRLIGELIGYPWSGIRPSVIVNNFKHLLLQKGLPDQSQILCGASLGRGNKILFPASGSHDQDGRHAHIYMVKTLQKSSSPEPAGRFPRNLVCSIGDSSQS